MATLKEMYRIWSLKPDHSKVCLRKALRYAEDNGECYNSVYTVKDDSDTYEIAGCTYWKVGDYEITYITDDLNFSARMLTEDMMNDLIIEKV